MPTRPPHPCTYPGCPSLVYDAGSRCPRHRRDTRPSAAARGYGSEWREIRAEKLRRSPMCTNPFTLHDGFVRAVLVDHIIPLRRGGTNDMGNLQSLCVACHNKKINDEDGGGFRN